jgi:hypothetical protein
MSNYKQLARKFLGINYCYQCGKCIWWSKDKLRYIEDVKSDGFLAPACQECIAYSENHFSNLSHEQKT